MIYLLLLLSFSVIYSSEITQVKLPELVARSVDTSTHKSVDVTNLVLNSVALLKNIAVFMPRNNYAYGLDKGVGVGYDELDKWVQWQLTGDKGKLVDRYQELLPNKSKTSARLRVTLEHIINSKLTDTMAVMANGSQQEADQKLRQLAYEQRLSPTALSYFEMRHATNIYTGRFQLEPQWDMAMTNVTTPVDYNLEAIKEFTADIKLENYKNFDAFMKASSDRMTLLKESKIFDAMVYQRQWGNRDMIIDTIDQVSLYTQAYAQGLNFDQFVKMSDHLMAVSLKIADPRTYAQGMKALLDKDNVLRDKLYRVFIQNPKKFSDCYLRLSASFADDYQKAIRAIGTKLKAVNLLIDDIKKDWNE